MTALSQDQTLGHSLDHKLAASSADAGAADFVALLKPRVMALVVFTAMVGLLAAPGSIHPVIGVVAVLCIAVAAGASASLNMWFDADIDAVMERTKNRPIPAGRMDPGTALGFGVTLSVASVTVMGLAVNYLAAGLLALTIGYYVFVYTMWLKRRTPQNIVIGGAAGAFPPMVGWAAVTGTVSPESLALFAIIFFWTPPHFWALSLFCSDDYERAGVPMLPVVAGKPSTLNHIMLYSLLVWPLGVLPFAMGFAGPLYLAVAGVLGAVFCALAFRLWRSGEESHARRMFSFSIFYLFSLFSALGLEALIGGLV